MESLFLTMNIAVCIVTNKTVANFLNVKQKQKSKQQIYLNISITISKENENEIVNVFVV